MIQKRVNVSIWPLQAMRDVEIRVSSRVSVCNVAYNDEIDRNQEYSRGSARYTSSFALSPSPPCKQLLNAYLLVLCHTSLIDR